MTRALALLLAAFFSLAACVARKSGTSGPADESFTLASRALGETRLVNVHVPSHASNRETVFAAPLPVLVMPDGGLDEDFPHVVAAVEALIERNAIRPHLVVGIPNTQRRRDLTGPTEVESDRKIAPQVGGSAAFRGFLRDELLPEIERRYDVTQERALIGESLAGLFVLETFLEEPTLFTHCVALDPSLWWNHGALVESAPARLAASDAPEVRVAAPRTLFFASSEEPSTREGCARLARFLVTAPPAGLRWQYIPRPDLGHATIFRGLELEALEEALR